jgi:hypothetical protein
MMQSLHGVSIHVCGEPCGLGFMQTGVHHVHAAGGNGKAADMGEARQY